MTKGRVLRQPAGNRTGSACSEGNRFPRDNIDGDQRDDQNRIQPTKPKRRKPLNEQVSHEQHGQDRRQDDAVDLPGRPKIEGQLADHLGL